MRGNLTKKWAIWPDMGGGQAVLSKEEQKMALGLLKYAKLGFLHQSCDVRNLVQSYLHRCCSNVKKFPDNRLV
jgi:hypothetical protein